MELRGRAVLHEIAAQGDEVIQNPILFVSSLIFAKNFSNRIPAIAWKNTTTIGGTRSSDAEEMGEGDGKPISVDSIIPSFFESMHLNLLVQTILDTMELKETVP